MIRNFWKNSLTDNPAEAAFTDFDRAKEEQDPEEHPLSSPSEQVEHKVETTDLLGLGDEAGPVGEASVASEPSASVPEALVADACGVATEAAVTDSSELVPPPTPNLVDPGTEPIQVDHSPSAPSKAPRTRVRSSRGGATTRWQEARRGWWAYFEIYENWLYHNSGEASVEVSGCAGSPTNTRVKANGG